MAVKFFVFALMICGAAALFEPIAESHRSAAIELFVPNEDGSYGSVEETYQALRSFHVLGIEPTGSAEICLLSFESLRSSSGPAKDIFYALKIMEILKCSSEEPHLIKGILSKLQSNLKDANSLLDYYYAIGGLVSIKNEKWISESSTNLEDASNIFHSIKTLSQSDGTWRYTSSEGESSPHAAGLALEALAGVLSLTESNIERSMIGVVKNDIVKLFDSLEDYDDGSLYFAEKPVDAISGNGGSLSATCSVVRGVTAFAAVIPEKLNIPEDKVVGIAKFFLSISVPGSSTEMYHQLDSLGNLEKNSVTIPLVPSLSATTLSLTSGDRLKVRVSTVLGSTTPRMVVNLIHAIKSNSKDAPIIHNQKLDFNPESLDYTLDFLTRRVDVGKYDLTFEVFPEDADSDMYSAGGQIQALVAVTGIIKISNTEIAVLDSDTGSAETIKKLDLSKEETVSLSANHLQKLQLSFRMTSPAGGSFKPHQVFLRLRHESNVQHIFLLKPSGKKFESVLDFLGLVEKFDYLSGGYTLELAVGDSAMENSFLKFLGTLELDLPEAPENTARPRPAVPDLASRFAPKPEITHIFRVPEKLPPAQLSYTFLALTSLPFLGFLIGLWCLGANLKNFPSTGLPMVSALLFHLGILAVLVLYVLFWIKLNLFTTLKYLGFLGIFLVMVGHHILSHLAYMSSKVKTN
uniref:Dolichyl-diphosphooligosaccharide--protein glycosyltransferase subunit 2 n=1 Tax=Araucaria cunninghamii TaxID=56994 RepID=A0A0D6R5Y4_ARACU